MVNSTCGTLRLDETTLNWVEGCITTKTTSPINTIKSPCGGIILDADDFRIQNGVVTLASDPIKTKPSSLTVCGGLYFDIKHFSVSNGKLTIIKTEKPVEKVTVSIKVEDYTGKDLLSLVNQDTNPSFISVIKGENIKVNAPVINGYKIQGDNFKEFNPITKDETVTFTYKKQINVTIEVKDTTGTDLSNLVDQGATPLVISALQGDNVSVQSPIIVGYQVQGAAIKEFSPITKDEVVAFTYAPDAPPEPEIVYDFNYTYDSNVAADKKVTVTGSSDIFVIASTKVYTQDQLIGAKLTVKQSGKDAVTTTLSADNIVDDAGLISLDNGSILNAPTIELASAKFTGDNVVAGTYIKYDATIVESASLVVS